MNKRRHKGAAARRLKYKDSWVVCFVLGLATMNYPFISIFNKPTLPFGIPLLYLYLFWGWFFSIVIIYLFSRGMNHDPRDGGRS
jgi:hypothetical protein